MHLLFVELRRESAKFKRSLVGLTVGTVFLLFVYRLLGISSAFGFFSNATAIAGGAWVYLAWSFCIGTSTQLARDLADDVAKGTLVRLQQSPAGMDAVLRGRFIASAMFSALSLVPLAVGVKFLFGASLHLSITGAAVLALFALQCYALCLLLASVVFVAKSERAAHLAVFLLGYTAALAPVAALFGKWAWAMPWSGMLTILRTDGPAPWVLFASLVETLLFIVLVRPLGRLSLDRLRRNGTLAHT